jgi:hypothetical protein
MFNGVSQQPAPLRLDNQFNKQINFNSDMVKGVSKRPATEFITKLTGNITADASIHTINTSITDKHKVVFTGDVVEPIEIFKFDGTKLSVNYESSECKTYVSSSTPKQDIRCVTIPEKTYILNRTVKVAEDSNPLDTPAGHTYFPKHSFIWAKQGVSEHEYTVRLYDKDEVLLAEHTVTAPAPSADSINPAKTNEIAQQLVEGLTPSLTAGYHLERTGSFIDYWFDGADLDWQTNKLKVEVEDSFGDTALVGINQTVVDFGDLPNQGIEYYPIAIIGDNGKQQGAFYVEWDAKEGAWRETRAFYNPDTGERLPELLVASTMPHILEKQEDDSFLVRVEEWSENTVGDNESSPRPSFVDSEINNLIFYRNRLGFLLENGLVFTNSGEFETLFPKSATSLLPTDPIDVDLTSEYKADLQYALPLQQMLILFADEVQATLTTGGGPLTVQTLKFDINTYYEADAGCKPVGSGGQIFFASPNGNYSSVRDYYVDRSSMTFESSNTTSHIPRYLPKNIIKFAKRPNEDTLFAISKEEANALFVHNYAWGAQGKTQNAWSKWLMDEQIEILDIDITNSILYLVVRRNEEAMLLKLDLTEKNTGSLPMSLHLDQMTQLTGTYNADEQQTYFTLPYSTVLDNLVLVDSETGLSLEEPEVVDSSTIRVIGEYDVISYYIGQQFKAVLEYNKFYPRVQQGIPSITSKAQLKTLYVTFTDTGEFKVRITPYNRDYLRDKINVSEAGLESYLTEGIKEEEFTGVTVGESITDSPPILSSQTKFPINASHSTTKIELISESYLPASFQLTAFEAEVNTRAREI